MKPIVKKAKGAIFVFCEHDLSSKVAHNCTGAPNWAPLVNKPAIQRQRMLALKEPSFKAILLRGISLKLKHLTCFSHGLIPCTHSVIRILRHNCHPFLCIRIRRIIPINTSGGGGDGGDGDGDGGDGGGVHGSTLPHTRVGLLSRALSPRLAYKSIPLYTGLDARPMSGVRILDSHCFLYHSEGNHPSYYARKPNLG